MSSQPPVTVAEYVLGSIRRDLLEGRYPFGSRLDQQALAEEYGVSIIPIRESLRQLEAEGLVRITPRRGAYVAELSLSELAEVYGLREVLEQRATAVAAARLTAAELDELETLARRLDEASDADVWLRLNREWHFRLYGAAESPVLLQLVTWLWDRCSLYRHIYPRQIERRTASAADHHRILEACRAGDAEAAGALVAAHIHRAAADVLSSSA